MSHKSSTSQSHCDISLPTLSSIRNATKVIRVAGDSTIQMQLIHQRGSSSIPQTKSNSHLLSLHPPPIFNLPPAHLHDYTKVGIFLINLTEYRTVSQHYLRKNMEHAPGYSTDTLAALCYPSSSSSMVSAINPAAHRMRPPEALASWPRSSGPASYGPAS
jgi:hypothetical protein